MSRGIDRERKVRRELEEEGWWTCRAAGSLGDADIVALKRGEQPLVIEVKSTAAGPFHSFGPADRGGLLAAANISGARPLLAWWPPRSHVRWIGPEDWPDTPERKIAA